MDRIVLERDDSLEKWDQAVLYRILEAMGIRERVTYRHGSAAAELLLCLPDAIAWSYARGGEWSRRIADLVVEVEKVTQRAKLGTPTVRKATELTSCR